jgi:hypothetical protein
MIAGSVSSANTSHVLTVEATISLAPEDSSEKIITEDGEIDPKTLL